MKNLKNIINHIFAPSSYRQGLHSYNNKNWHQAMNAFDQAIKEKPTHPQSNFKLGLCHMKLGNLAEAHQYIQEALKLAPYNHHPNTVPVFLFLFRRQLTVCNRSIIKNRHIVFVC